MSLKQVYSVWIDVGGTHTRLYFKSKSLVTVKKIDIPTTINIQSDIIKILKPFHNKALSIVAGVRGVWTSPEKKAWGRSLQRREWKVTVLSDIQFEFNQRFSKKPGIILNAGTGSIAFGRNIKGEIARAGGFGPLIGDEGSSFWIGREYLRKILINNDNFGFIRKFIKSENPVPSIASLSKEVLFKAQHSDAMSLSIVNEAQSQLLQLLDKLKSDLKIKSPVQVVLTGGLFKSQFFKKKFLKKLSKKSWRVIK